jgi:cytochrome d ubiquinol oxidase subunit II
MSCALLVAIIAVSIWTPIAHTGVAARWFTFPNILLFAPVPILVFGLTMVQIWVLRRDKKHALPFLIGLVLVFLGYTGLAISIWPNIIPPSISIWSAAAPEESMGFALVGTMFIIPVILVYTSWSYYVFRIRPEPAPELGS